jgi:hypothetical protein
MESLAFENLEKKRIFNTLLCVGPPVWGLDEGVTTSHRKKNSLLQNVTQGFGIAGPYEHGNDPSGSLKGREFLD